MRCQFRVTTKAAIFSDDGNRVILIHMTRNNAWGLPGGHVEDGENPDDTIKCELQEECGITVSKMKHGDFFMHSDGKVILAYIVEPVNEVLHSEQDNLEGVPKWVTKSEFSNIENIEKVYRDFILKNWPKK